MNNLVYVLIVTCPLDREGPFETFFPNQGFILLSTIFILVIFGHGGWDLSIAVTVGALKNPMNA